MADKTLTKDEILDGIANLSVLELSELLKEFEEKFGVTAAAPVAVAAAPAAGGDAGGAEEEKSEFDVVLMAAGDKKIQVIKEVRALTSLRRPEAQSRSSRAEGFCLDGTPAYPYPVGGNRMRVAPSGACAYTVRLPCPVFAPLLKSDP